jgi:hypothetical protein
VVVSYKLAIEIRQRELAAHARETLARALKVVRIVDLVPKGATRAENEALAAVLASWDQADRDRFAAVAGARTPSEESWRLVVDVVRGRALPRETDQDAPILRVLRGGRS